MKKTWKIVLISTAVLAVAGTTVLIGGKRMGTEKRAANLDKAGIMSKQDSYTLEELTNKYGYQRKAITQEDFETLMALLKKGAVEPGQDNIKQSANFGMFAGLLGSVDMTEAQKQVVVAAMRDALRQPDTPQDQIKFFVFYIMDSMKDDSLVQEALPYANGKNTPTRTIAQQYLKTVGYKM